ncbi:MAG: hypothetical protein J6L58_02990 [Clostridia bacterium]|nr:hypothetical protein [Clostridia bacterium]
MSLVQIIGICIIAAAISVVLKEQKAEYALMVSLIASAAILILLVISVADKLLEIRNAVSSSSASFFLVALKALGICVLTGFVADACREAGQVSLANKAELAGRCAVFILSVPMLISLLNMALGFIK